jgi:hypothetical protein
VSFLQEPDAASGFLSPPCCSPGILGVLSHAHKPTASHGTLPSLPPRTRLPEHPRARSRHPILGKLRRCLFGTLWQILLPRTTPRGPGLAMASPCACRVRARRWIPRMCLAPPRARTRAHCAHTATATPKPLERTLLWPRHCVLWPSPLPCPRSAVAPRPHLYLCPDASSLSRSALPLSCPLAHARMAAHAWQCPLLSHAAVAVQEHLASRAGVNASRPRRGPAVCEHGHADHRRMSNPTIATQDPWTPRAHDPEFALT